MQMETIKADITRIDVDVIVNAANKSLLGGGGVDGAIHRSAGPRLLKACRALGGCKTGEAKLTPGFNLPAQFIVHTVGPVWHGGGNEAKQLASCYRNSLALADDVGAHSIAFPCISTGVYGYPVADAAQIAINTTKAECVANATGIERIVFCCFSDDDLEIYQSLIAET